VKPAEIKDSRFMTDGTWEVLVKWDNLPDCENTWERYSELPNQFPKFPLEDKVKLLGGKDVRPNIKCDKTYNRRKRQLRSEGPIEEQGTRVIGS